jgi:hypothetical protein
MAPIVVVLLAVSFARCRKGVDAFGHGLVDCNDCNIQQITVVHTDELGKDTVVYSFTYNAAGDPVTVKNTAVATGNPNAVFKYDRRGKLAEMVRPYDNTSYETWTKYFYDSRGQIVRDTQYIFGTYIDSVPGADLKQGYWIHHFGYDAYGRVISRIDSSFFGSVSVTGHSFQYDARGNLVVSGAVYDTDVNFLRTNKIWMFVCNNYSVNNAFLATAYNGHKLPLSFDGVYPTMAPVVTETGKYKMVYKCR